MLKFPRLTFVQGPRSPALEVRMRAAIDAIGECSAGPVRSVVFFFSINYHQWHQALKSFVIILFLQMIIIFKSQQYWVQWYVII